MGQSLCVAKSEEACFSVSEEQDGTNNVSN